MKKSRTRKACDKDAARELLKRGHATIGFFKHSVVEAKRLSALPVEGDRNDRGLLSDVSTRWGSTYEALERLYSMWLRLSVSFRSSNLSSEQRGQRVSNRDWDGLRHIIRVLTPVYEVTKVSQSGTASLADVFSLSASLRKTLLLDTVAVPKLPDVPFAVGEAAIEVFLEANPDEDVMEVDGRLYGSENVYVEPTDGFDVLCGEARTAVHLLRTELDRLFFNPGDDTKNWVKNPAVTSALLVTPGGYLMLKEVSDWLNFDDPIYGAIAALK